MVRKLLKITGIFVILLLSVIAGYCLLNYRGDVPVEELKAKYATSESKFIDIGGANIHYRDEGVTENKIPIVLLHGIASNLKTWDGWTESLKKEHRVIRLDLPGFGLTGANTTNDYSMESYVATLSTFLDKLGVSKCYLAGNSMGGRIAWEFALAHPEKVEKLILLDATGYPNDDGTPLPIRLAQMPIVNKVLLRVTPKSLIEKSLKEIYIDDSKVTEELVQQYYDMACREGNRTAFIARANAPSNENYRKIGQIKAPTLILWGDSDAWVSVADAKRFENDLPNDKTIIYKNLGHIPMEENPTETVKDVLEFIKQ